MVTSKKLAAIFDHFSAPQETKDGKVVCICKCCGKSISGRIKTTSNFVTHMKVGNSILHIIMYIGVGGGGAGGRNCSPLDSENR